MLTDNDCPQRSTVAAVVLFLLHIRLREYGMGWVLKEGRLGTDELMEFSPVQTYKR